MKIAILGFGREGKSVLKFLKKSQRFKGVKIEILDKKKDGNYLKNLKKNDLIFRSPGIPYNLPELIAARRVGVKFSGATDLFFKNYKGRVIGITGTKGKGTTSTLLYKILKTAGRKVILAGNIGKPALDFITNNTKCDLAVVELSSFQLQDLTISPEIAVILDVFPDHLDAHKNLKEYYNAKANIGKYQRKNDKIFFLADNRKTKQLASESPAKKIAVDWKKNRLFGPNNLKIRGFHNFRNAVMAATVALDLGVPKNIILETIKNFKGLKHRLEFVRLVKNVGFYNDSASTNPQTMIAAIKSFPKEKKVIICGGQDKNLDYSPLSRVLKLEKVGLVVIFGENKIKIIKAIKNSGIPVKMTKDLNFAVKEAFKNCLKIGGGNIIFSPGAASFDMFKDYADRGVQFKKIVRLLR